MSKVKVSPIMWVSIICYVVIIFGGLLFGFLYILNPNLLDYHLNAVGVSSMSAIPRGSRIMFQTFKRAAGFGLISNAAAMIILLLCQAIKKYKWAPWGLFLIAAPYWFALFINVKKLELHTRAGAPMIPNLIVALLSIIGVIAAALDYRRKC